MNQKLRIAIDGPAGAGKSTAAKEVSKKINFLYIDTGAMYRAVTLAAINNKIDLTDEAAVTRLAREMVIEIVPDTMPGGKMLYRIFAGGDDVTSAIRTPLVSQRVSIVAKIPGVREILLQKQRDLARGGGVVMEGRDVGTVVLPGADYKFFLTASPGERARRRRQELLAAGYAVDPDILLEEIMERDRIDSTREIAPLTPAPDAITIDCSEMNVDQVVDLIVSAVTDTGVTDTGATSADNVTGVTGVAGR